MRILALHPRISSVGGINTELVNMRKEASDLGHEFFVYETWPWKTFAFKHFDEPINIRGGDTYILVDGKVSHYAPHLQEVASWINENFDSVFISCLCPRDNKAYREAGVNDDGTTMFNDLLDLVSVPIVGRVTDGYFSAYKSWGRRTMQQCVKTTCSRAYRPSIPEDAGEVKLVEIPFRPTKHTTMRSSEVSVVNVSQYKNVKGTVPMLEAIPLFNPNTQVDLYSCGILYYQLRTKEIWLNAVRKDFFKEFHGNGIADYHGYVDVERMPDILSHAWMGLDLQGWDRKGRYEAYKKGSLNNTGIEMLYYGCLPIVYETTPIPDELCAKVTTVEEIAEVVNSKRWQDIALNPERQEAAKKWVIDRHCNLFESMVLPPYRTIDR